MKQINIGSFLGSVKLLAQHVTPYLSIFTLGFAAISAYVTIAAWLRDQGIDFPFWIFLILLTVSIVLLFIFEYTVVFPSFFSAWNKQWWDHDNPMRKEMEDLSAKIDKVIEEKGK